MISHKCAHGGTLAAAAEISLCRNCSRRVAQLCQHCAEQTQFVSTEPTGKCICQRGDAGGQFTGIHEQNTPCAIL